MIKTERGMIMTFAELVHRVHLIIGGDLVKASRLVTLNLYVLTSDALVAGHDDWINPGTTDMVLETVRASMAGTLDLIYGN